MQEAVWVQKALQHLPKLGAAGVACVATCATADKYTKPKSKHCLATGTCSTWQQLHSYHEIDSVTMCKC